MVNFTVDVSNSGVGPVVDGVSSLESQVESRVNTHILQCVGMVRVGSDDVVSFVVSTR